jgi:hypothetical protein
MHAASCPDEQRGIITPVESPRVDLTQDGWPKRVGRLHKYGAVSGEDRDEPVALTLRECLGHRNDGHSCFGGLPYTIDDRLEEPSRGKWVGSVVDHNDIGVARHGGEPGA